MKLQNYVFLFILAIAILSTFGAMAQTQPNAPKDGFEIALSAQKINLKAGETQTITAELIRSKRFSKTQIEFVATSSNPALTIKITPSTTNTDLFEVSVATSTELQAGNYNFTLMGKSSFLRKGKLIDVVVAGKAQEANNSENK